MRDEPKYCVGHCVKCGETILVEDLIRDDVEGTVCLPCLADMNKSTCAWCGDVEDIVNLIDYDGDLGCPDCVVKVHVCWIDDTFCSECGVKA